ncbi:universal stress protein [Desulfogranum japonicum]|uniref:universal stress protein n=1 Tax=Desulfogranum japonicum TaxID=231447 RepID=UPI0003F8D2CA|nr:universal stress protein [Desulfogranum japonicum]
MKKSILVAIDGSVYSSNSLDYLIKIFGPLANLNIHLFSVVQAGSSGQDWMFEVDPLREKTPLAEKKTHLAHRYLKDAKARLLRNGFSKEDVDYSVKTSVSGITTAIHHEANHGNYDALLLGRRGIGAMGTMLFGSTSMELIEKCHEVPLWITDGEVNSNRFLLAVQSKPESLMAADHLAFILNDHPEVEICLYHSNSMFGQQEPSPKEHFHGQWGKEWCDQYLDLENFLFYAHAQILKDNGISPSRITQLPAQMHVDPGFDLLRQAKKYNCGTIVIGRRGRGTDKGLLKGVSDRTVQKAQNVAVWLVG